MDSTSGKTPDERLDALEMRTNALSDAMIVQGYLEGRIERNLAELSDKENDLTDDVRILTGITQTLADNQSRIQTALEGLIAQIDRFVRGQPGNGHGAA